MRFTEITKLTITVASHIDSDDLATELWCDDEMWGEVKQVNGDLLLTIYPQRSGDPWTLKLNEVQEILEKARLEVLQQVKPE